MVEGWGNEASNQSTWCDCVATGTTSFVAKWHSMEAVIVNVRHAKQHLRSSKSPIPPPSLSVESIFLLVGGEFFASDTLSFLSSPFVCLWVGVLSHLRILSSLFLSSFAELLFFVVLSPFLNQCVAMGLGSLRLL
ncbi:unnamed protein product [Choristocarpus tenellus]